MLIMNFSEQSNREQPAAPGKRLADRPQGGDWMVSSNYDAPFDYTCIQSKGLKNITEVASIATVTEQFISGGGSIARPEMYIPGIGTLISCRDCIGHMFTFFEAELPVRPEIVTGID